MAIAVLLGGLHASRGVAVGAGGGNGDKHEWVLTPDALAGLLHFLHADPARAAADYEQIRQRLMKLFRWRGCLSFEEYTDITIDRVARRIADGADIRTPNPYALFYGVAVNLLREHWRNTERERKAFDRLQRSHEPEKSAEELMAREHEETDRATRVACLRRCLRQLPAESLALIKRYYAEGTVLDKNQRKQMAGELNISVNALRVRAHRIRIDVGECIELCLVRMRRVLK